MQKLQSEYRNSTVNSRQQNGRSNSLKDCLEKKQNICLSYENLQACRN